MRLGEDDRGRVPFALLGVLLLVGASTYAADLGARGVTERDRDVEAVLAGVERDLRPAIRTAVRDAAAAAARNPVTRPADTPVGRLLDDRTVFRDALRLRIALTATGAVSAVRRRRDDAVATASLPPIRNVRALGRAMDGVTLRGVDGGRALRVTVRGVRLQASRDGRVVLTRRVTVTLTVRTPVLLLHDRVEGFERRLNRDPLEGPGLGRQLTVRLYPVVWARAYGQYAGAPIVDVLGNRHVALSTNAAVLSEQRRAFGRADPAAGAGLSVLTARAAAGDVAAPFVPRGEAVAARVFRPNAADDGRRAGSRPTRRRQLVVSPDAAADEVFLDLVDPDSLDAIFEGTYRATARLEATAELVARREFGTPPPAGEAWVVTEQASSHGTTVTPAGNRLGGEQERDRARTDGNRTWLLAHRTVTVTEARTTTWRHPDGRSVQSSRRVEKRYRVTVRVTGQYAPRDRSPAVPASPIFERGGALDGPNLGGIPARARAQLLKPDGSVDVLAGRAVHGGAVTRAATLTGERPDGLAAWVGRDLARLRERVRAVEVTVDPRAVAAGEANPAAALARRLRRQRAALVDPPATYDGAAGRARIAARAAYVDAVVRRLEERAAATRTRNAEYLEVVGAEGARRLARLVALGGSGTSADYRREAAGTDVGAPLVPDGTPPTLTLRAVDSDHVPAVPPDARHHPLVARTVTWVALAHADAGTDLADELLGGERVRLETAARTLVAADRALATRPDERLRARRATLRRAIRRPMAAVTGRVAAVVADELSLDRPGARRLVRVALGRWEGPGRRALAATNGSLASAVAAEARRRGATPRAADHLAVRVRVAIRSARATDAIRVPESATSETASATRRLARAATAELVAKSGRRATQHLLQRWARLRVTRLPAGLPVAPVPGYWYATVNAWSVTVRGEYRRFALRALVGPPDGAGAVVTYVRDGSAVSLDVDGDGRRERLGWGERVSFEVSTTVAVAVPPGPPGVGDADGDRLERSPGWPCPGDDGRESCAAANRDGG